MKKLFIIFALVLLSCSSDSQEIQEEGVCCDTTIEELKKHTVRNYEAYFEANPNMSESRRKEIQAEYDRAMEDPCGTYKEMLERQGVTDCQNP